MSLPGFVRDFLIPQVCIHKVLHPARATSRVTARAEFDQRLKCSEWIWFCFREV